ncbi:MAG: molybdopterin-dependent oxidoreductase [Candidatus Lokiarchaeia archaeon]
MNIKERLTLLKEKKPYRALIIVVILIGTSLIIGFTFLINENPSSEDREGFPDFITKNEDYFITRIGNIPNINPDTYSLLVWGQVSNSKAFTLPELQALNLTERTLTTECIGNPTKGYLLSTANWKGFLIYDLIGSLGLKDGATGVRYLAADGYYASHTLDQLKSNRTIGALYMNGEVLPPVQGYPLSVVNPGAYGAKQPAWVIEIEVINRSLENYWDDRGWDTSPPMNVDSTIFFPENNKNVEVGVPLEIGGAAFGGTRILKIEYTINDGLNWNQVEIVRSLDMDHVWVFWNISIIFNYSGTFTFYIKATDIYNNSQPQFDSYGAGGVNSWPYIFINAID